MKGGMPYSARSTSRNLSDVRLRNPMIAAVRVSAAAMAVFLLTGCVGLVANETTAELVRQLAKDNASACLAVSVMVGGGALIPAPAVPLMGGSGWLYVGRTNQPGSKVNIDGSGCRIEHGP